MGSSSFIENSLVSTPADDNIVLVSASPDTVGAFPIRQDITVLPPDDPKEAKLGWVIYEEVGLVIVNDYAVTKIDVRQPFRWVDVETPVIMPFWPDSIGDTGRMFDME